MRTSTFTIHDGSSGTQPHNDRSEERHSCADNRAQERPSPQSDDGLTKERRARDSNRTGYPAPHFQCGR